MAKSLPGHGVVCRASNALRRLRLYFLAARQNAGVDGVEEAYPVEAGGVYPNRHWTDDARDVVFGIIGSPGRPDYVPAGAPAPPAVPVAVQNQMRVGELIEALLQYDPGQEILTQAVMPDGAVFYAVPIKLFEVIGSVGGAGGRPYVGLSVRVPHADRGG